MSLPRKPGFGCWRALLAGLVTLGLLAAAQAQSGDDANQKKKKATPSASAKRDLGQMPPPVGTFAPAYLSPSGNGAGDTGYVSQKKSAKKKQGAQKNAKDNSAATPSQNQALRNPSIARAQAIASPEVTGTVSPRLRRRVQEEEPYGAVGFHAGAFLITPSVELQRGFDTNALKIPNGPDSWFNAVQGQLQAKSEWTRHELSLDLRGSYTAYTDVEGADRPDLLTLLRARIDVTSVSKIELESKFGLTTENPGSPDAIAAVRRQPNVYAFGQTAAWVQRFNRFEVTAGVGVERNLYESAELTNGASLSLADRDYIQYSARLRGAYEWSPDVKPFVEASVDKRERDLPVDFSGIRRDSDGYVLRGGITFGRTELLSGEVSAGLAHRSYADPSLNDISGLIFDASLIWRATGLTTFRLNASSGIDETSVPGASGVLRREARLTAEHAFRRWLIGSASIGFLTEEYRGAGLVNDYLRSSIALTYYLNRSLALKAEYRNERLFSDTPGQDYTANIGLIGLRLQR
jgi:hypothetical protein